MTSETREITDASLRVAWDLGHGGTYSVYRIERTRDAYEVSVTIGRSFPGPGESRFRPSEVKESLRKESSAVAEFLGRLSLVYRVFELEDLPSPRVFLHPKFYRFQFNDSRGGSHGFEYSTEAGRHHSETYRRLVEDFEEFFESERVSRSFSESERASAECSERDERPWWKFW
jgi:hypothetical protein